jgi:release factor glutamine methyltransferase
VLTGWAIDQVKQGFGRVVELCAGSGAISRAIVTEALPSACWAVERSDQAYTYLVQNLADTCVVPVHQDMAEALRDLDGTVDLVVANPPYVPTGQQVPADVQYDPDEALYSGDDGLDAIRMVADVAKRLLRPGGVVGCEHGEDHAGEVREIFAHAGFDRISTNDDLTNRPRFVTARKTGAGHAKMEP